MRSPLSTLLAAVATVCLASQGFPADRPNIVLIYADDLGYADLGCFGAKKIKTPNLDRMAKQGTRFTSFYVAQPVCSASRAAILTGKYPNRTGILGALGPPNKIGLARHHVTIAEMLKSLGYAQQPPSPGKGAFWKRRTSYFALTYGPAVVGVTAPAGSNVFVTGYTVQAGSRP